ncbi:MAG: hypothetical protein JSS16_04370 [Proteobacteria bacterium]|nr:hypothetical protein [Pseudomonadota bacterium]
MSKRSQAARTALFIAILIAQSACDSHSEGKVNKLNPESEVLIVPPAVERDRMDIVETEDEFRGRKRSFLLDTHQEKVYKSYQAQRSAALQSSPLRTQDDWIVFDWDPGYPPDTPPPPPGDSYVKPGGFIYAKAKGIQSGRLNWFVLCSRLKFRDTPRGCWLRGRIGDKYYEVMMNEPDLPYAEDLNTFIQAHL